MRFTTFFRNVNLGRPGKPTRVQFIEVCAAIEAQLLSVSITLLEA